MVSIKLCKDGENDEYIILCNFGGRITSSFGVIEVGLWRPPPPRFQGEKKSPVWIGLMWLLYRDPLATIEGAFPPCGTYHAKCLHERKRGTSPLLLSLYDNKIGRNISLPSLSFALLYPSGWRMCPYLCWRNVFVYLGRVISALFSLIK